MVYKFPLLVSNLINKYELIYTLKFNNIITNQKTKNNTKGENIKLLFDVSRKNRDKS